MRLLIVSASFGTGHNQVAEAIREAALEQGHGAEVCDGLAVGMPTMNTLLTRGYLRLLAAAPSLYRYAYNYAETPGRWAGLTHSSLATLGRAIWPRLAPMLARTQPDAVLCTHPFPLGALAGLRRRRQLAVPLAGVLTDFAPHSLWVHPGVDQYYVATAGMAETLTGQGVPAARLATTGIPLRSGFLKPMDRTAAAAALGLDPTQPTALVMGGGLGLGPIGQAVSRVMRLRTRLQLLVVAGRNPVLQSQLQALAANPQEGVSLHVYGHVPFVPTLMAAADLLVSKPGAVTASEALAMGLPMLMLPPVPGQEERNRDLLEASGAASGLEDLSELPQALAGLLENPAALQSMRLAAARIARPDAARRLLHHVTGLADSKKERTA